MKANESSKVTLTMKQLKKLVKENIADADSIDIRLGSGGGYYGGKSNIHIHATDEGDREAGWDLTYEFSQPGWDFETTYQLEAAALIANSKFWKDEQLAKVPAEKENLDQQWADAAYWCSGGNALWKFGQDEDFVGNWDESKDEVEKLFRERYEKDILACSNLLEIVAVMKKANDNFITVLYDECPDLWDYEDEDSEVEVEPTDEGKKAVKEGFDTEDGWDCDEIRDSGLMDTLRKCSNVEYNLRTCNRGAANWGDTLGDLKAYVNELAEEMKNDVADFPEEDEEDMPQDAMGDDEEFEVVEEGSEKRRVSAYYEELKRCVDNLEDFGSLFADNIHEYNIHGLDDEALIKKTERMASLAYSLEGTITNIMQYVEEKYPHVLNK